MARAGSPTPSPGSASAPAARQCSPAWSRSPGGARFAPPLPAGLSRHQGRWLRPLLSGVAYGVARLGVSLVLALALLVLLALAAGAWRSARPRLPAPARRRTG